MSKFDRESQKMPMFSRDALTIRVLIGKFNSKNKSGILETYFEHNRSKDRKQSNNGQSNTKYRSRKFMSKFWSKFWSGHSKNRSDTPKIY